MSEDAEFSIFGTSEVKGVGLGDGAADGAGASLGVSLGVSLGIGVGDADGDEEFNAPSSDNPGFGLSIFWLSDDAGTSEVKGDGSAVGDGAAPGKGIIGAVEVDNLGFFTAKASQLKRTSAGAGLFSQIENPVVVLWLIK